LPTKADEPLLPNRVVIDTNIWISAILSTMGNPAEVVARAVGSLAHVFSLETFSELETRIWKPKFDRYVSRETRQLLLHDVSASANWVEIPPILASQTFSRDPNDDKFVHAALAARAQWLITGDDDLLVLGTVDGIQILSATQALAQPNFPQQPNPSES
jgi:uncharacterized protein